MAVSPLEILCLGPAFLGPIQVLSDGRSRCVRALALRLGWCKHGRATLCRVQLRFLRFRFRSSTRDPRFRARHRIDILMY